MFSGKNVRFVGAKKDKAFGFILVARGDGVVETLRTRNKNRLMAGELEVGPVQPRHESRKEVGTSG